MADVKMPEHTPCTFALGWGRVCNKPSNNGLCSEHENLTCRSCGGKAVRSCEHAVSLVCGAPLCETCQHGQDGEHVTAEVFSRQIQEERHFEKTGQESPAMLAKRGVPEGLPKNLFEILKGNRNGWTLTPCWTLELSHGLMGCFPAIVRDTHIRLVSTDKATVIRVWRTLEPRPSELIEFECMVNNEGTVAYPMRLDEFEQRHSLPFKLFSVANTEALLTENPEAFEWAPGLFGTDLTPTAFEEIIRQAEHSLAQ